AEVGVTGQAIYRHFPSKQDMLGEPIGQAGQDLRDSGEAIEQECSDTYQGLWKRVNLQPEFAFSSPEVMRLQDRDLAAVERRRQRQIRRTQREYIDIWIRGIQPVHPDETDEQLLVRAHALFGLINSTGHSFSGLAKRQQTS